jgi:hypothetical protein
MENNMRNGMSLKNTPDKIRIRIFKKGDWFEIIRRKGNGWEFINKFKNYDKAIDYLSPYLQFSKEETKQILS